MAFSDRKIKAARTSIATATFLALLKLATGISSGSMAVLSSAIDSLIDILMSGVNFLAIKQAEKPADQNHPFGHGKFETIATLFQSVVITLSGCWILYESIRRIAAGSGPTKTQEGVAVLAFSVVASFWISRYLRKVAKETDSSALEADSLHFAMDVYTNLALALGLVVIELLNIPWLDPILSIFVACYILYEAIRLVRRGMGEVLDEGLPQNIRREVEDLIENHNDLLVDYHNLRTRRAGSQKIIDFHLTVCKHLSVEKGHAIADHLEKRIQDEIPGSDVTIHIEPCTLEHCPGRKDCVADMARVKKCAPEKNGHT